MKIYSGTKRKITLNKSKKQRVSYLKYRVELLLCRLASGCKGTKGALEMLKHSTKHSWFGKPTIWLSMTLRWTSSPPEYNLIVLPCSSVFFSVPTGKYPSWYENVTPSYDQSKKKNRHSWNLMWNPFKPPDCSKTYLFQNTFLFCMYLEDHPRLKVVNNHG